MIKVFKLGNRLIASDSMLSIDEYDKFSFFKLFRPLKRPPCRECSKLNRTRSRVSKLVMEANNSSGMEIEVCPLVICPLNEIDVKLGIITADGKYVLKLFHFNDNSFKFVKSENASFSIGEIRKIINQGNTLSRIAVFKF